MSGDGDRVVVGVYHTALHCRHLLHLILFKEIICWNHPNPRIIKTLHHLKPEGWLIKEFSSFHNTDILILIDIVGFPISELTKENMTMAEKGY